MSLSDDYKRWWNKLSKDQKQKLKETNFDYTNWVDDGIPTAHRYFGGESQNHDENDFVSTLGNGFDINKTQFEKWIVDKNKMIDKMNKSNFTFDEVLMILNRVISILDDSNDRAVKLHATCIKIALGMPNQPSMTTLAKEHALTRAAVSLRVKTIQRNLGLPPSIYMKSEHACDKLSKARRKKQ